MFDKLQGIEDKLEKINSSLCDPEVVSNQEEYKKADARSENADADS